MKRMMPIRPALQKVCTLISALTLVIALAGCAGSSPSDSAQPGAKPAELIVFAASSLTQPLDELIAAYGATHPDIKLTVNYGGSGALQTQLEQGAPADLFISASPAQMDALEKADLIDKSTRADLLTNEIVLIVPADQPIKVGSFNDVAMDAVGKIALGDPASVPAGAYAREVFTALKCWDAVSGKATYATDVRQVLSWVESGNVDCGVVYKTDALSDKAVKLIAEAPYGSHSPIVYPAALVKAGARQKDASGFLKYLQSDSAAAIFEKYGFSAA